MSIEQLTERTKKFSLDIIKLFQELPKTDEARIIGKQLLRSGTSVGVNHRAVNRARSKKEFFAKLSIVVEEADEVLFWLEILEEAHIVDSNRILKIKSESLQLVKIFSKARKSVREEIQNSTIK